MEKIIRILEMGVISLSTLGTKGTMFAVWASGSVRIYMSRFSWLVFNNINESTQIWPNRVNRPKHRSYSTLSSIASQGKTLKQSLLRNEEGSGGGSEATALSSYAINPWFLTGLSDGEGSFGVSIINSPASRVSFSVKPVFSIGLHTKDGAVLEQIKSLWGVGKIYYGHGPQTIQYRVESIKELQTVIKHFDKFPLITQKLADYLLFKEVVSRMERKEHLTQEGLEKIVGIKAAINRGLSDKLKVAFPDIIPVARPLVELALAGFVEGDGTLCVAYNT